MRATRINFTGTANVSRIDGLITTINNALTDAGFTSHMTAEFHTGATRKHATNSTIRVRSEYVVTISGGPTLTEINNSAAADVVNDALDKLKALNAAATCTVTKISVHALIRRAIADTKISGGIREFANVCIVDSFGAEDDDVVSNPAMGRVYTTAQYIGAGYIDGDFWNVIHLALRAAGLSSRTDWVCPRTAITVVDAVLNYRARYYR